MKEIFLIAHIGGALVTAIVILVGLSVLAVGRRKYYHSIAVCVGFGGGFELLSGSLLALWSAGTVLSFCSRIGIYAAAVLLVELIFFIAIRNLQYSFPKKLVTLPLGVGGIASIAALAVLVLR